MEILEMLINNVFNKPKFFNFQLLLIASVWILQVA